MSWANNLESDAENDTRTVMAEEQCCLPLSVSTLSHLSYNISQLPGRPGPLLVYVGKIELLGSYVLKTCIEESAWDLGGEQGEPDGRTWGVRWLEEGHQEFGSGWEGGGTRAMRYEELVTGALGSEWVDPRSWAALGKGARWWWWGAWSQARDGGSVWIWAVGTLEYQ
jgi:hypothetical protein